MPDFSSTVDPLADISNNSPEQQPVIEEKGILYDTESLPYHLQRRIETLRRLKSYEQGPHYAKAKLDAAKELGISLRSLYRLIRQFREEGIEGLMRQTRSDQGQSKTDADWQGFVLKAYRQGNRGMRSTNPSQIVNLVKSHALEQGLSDYPSRATVYRILEPEIAARSQKQKKRAIGWQGEGLHITTREGIELVVEYSNQVWQCDHTPADILVVDQQGDFLGRPTLTTVVDTYSRCIVGIHLGLGYPSAAVTCLALRHAILPKRYSSDYGLSNLWGTYGIPQYLYTDAGSDFTSRHIDQVAAGLGMVLCLRRKPSDGGIVERPFGSLNSEFFSTLPGYTTSRLEPHRTKVKAEACLTLHQLERLLVRYIVDRYNQLPDPRFKKQSRLARWEAGRIVQPPLPDERELDVLLMRQDRRRVYNGGYIRFANLVYKGEFLAAYAGEQVALRYNPRDITTILVYRQNGARDVFLTRAHAQRLETERLTLAEAKAISGRLRQASKAITNESVWMEVRNRTHFVNDLLVDPSTPLPGQPPNLIPSSASEADTELEEDDLPFSKPLPDVQVYDYEQLRQEHGL